GLRVAPSASAHAPDLVICDIARVDADEVADAWPETPILGFTNHTDTTGLQRAHTAGFDQVLVRSALSEPARQVVDEPVVVDARPGLSSGAVGRLGLEMTYIIAEPCIDIKDRSCVDVCPVDCIHE